MQFILSNINQNINSNKTMKNFKFFSLPKQLPEMSKQDKLRLEMQKKLVNADLLSGKMLYQDNESTTYVLLAKVKNPKVEKPREKTTLQDNLLWLAVLVALFTLALTLSI
jgi:hypothetical protein